MYFKLFPEVYLIIGKKKSLLQNIANGRIFWFDNDIAHEVKNCENNVPISDEFFKYATELEKNDWGIITEKPIFSEKLRLVNVSDKRMFHPKALDLNQAIIKLTNRCNLECNICGKIFCPSCIKEKSSYEDISFKLFENIINNLKTYRCKTVLLTGGEISLTPNLKEFCDLLKKMNFNIILNTNGIKKLDNSFISTNILISIFSKKNLIKIIDNYKDFKNITILKYCNDLQNSVFPNIWKVIDSPNVNHKITKKNLINTSIDRFYIRQNRNSCLNGKIVITQNGDVYPCLESIKLNKKVSNVNDEDWENIIQKLSNNFWQEKIDQHEICCDCEFRYACNSCIFDNVKDNCSYNKETGLWQ